MFSLNVQSFVASTALNAALPLSSPYWSTFPSAIGYYSEQVKGDMFMPEASNNTVTDFNEILKVRD